MKPNVDYILVIEDDPDDQYLILLAMKAVNEDIRIEFIGQGDSAISWFSQVDQPMLSNIRFVVLDLNLPGANGMDVLQAIRREARTKHLPVAILSTSQFEAEHKRALSLGANHVFVKPNSLDMLQDIFNQLVNRYDREEGEHA